MQDMAELESRDAVLTAAEEKAVQAAADASQRNARRQRDSEAALRRLQVCITRSAQASRHDLARRRTPCKSSQSTAQVVTSIGQLTKSCGYVSGQAAEHCLQP